MSVKQVTLPTALAFSRKRNFSDYTKPEIDRIMELANFSDDESDFFTLRSKGKSNVAIAMSMCISDSKLHEIRRKVESKIQRISTVF